MRVLILSSDTGGGHRASAAALHSALEQVYPGDLTVNVVDFWVDFAEGPFSNFPSQYTFLAKHPVLWKMTYEITRFPPGRAVTEGLFTAFGHDKVRDAFVKFAPDLIISVHPLVNTLSVSVISEIQKRSKFPGAPRIPYVTVVTDLAGAHPTWFHRDADMIYIPSSSVSKTAAKCDVANGRTRIYGLPVRPDFWQPLSQTKQQLRAMLGLIDNVPAILAVGGGDGVGGLQAIATALGTNLPTSLAQAQTSSAAPLAITDGRPFVQVVVICGKNEKLRKWLNSQTWSVPIKALGYVTNMSEWMGAVDIICTKAGPGTIAESLIRGLPMVLTGYLPGQEEANVKLVVEHGVGAFAKKPSQVVKVVQSWLRNPSALVNMSAKARALGRPHASLDIAKDVIQLTRNRISAEVTHLEAVQQQVQQRRRARVSQGLLAPYVPFSEFVNDNSQQGFRTGEEGGYGRCDDQHELGWGHSLLGRRIKVLLKIAVGSLMARYAITSGLRWTRTNDGQQSGNNSNDNDDSNSSDDIRTLPSSPLLERITQGDDDDNADDNANDDKRRKQ